MAQVGLLAGQADTGAAPDGPPRIGPNAITRIAEALRARRGEAACRAVFAAAGLSPYLGSPPTHMVAEAEVVALHRALVATLGPEAAAAIGAEAGRLTGAYLLANRIPRLAQALLRRLPRPLAARLFAVAIARHAWTFAGSGRFTWRAGRNLELTLADAPLCWHPATAASARPYLEATFASLFSAILGPVARVRETARAVAGASACSFEVTWR